MPQMVQGHDVGAGMGHSEKLLEIAFNQRRRHYGLWAKGGYAKT